MGIRVALAGNPNCGKTTLFNNLTGANQYVGNWPGVTVERKEGTYVRNKEVAIVDLPGIYSLSPYSPEEIVSREYLIDDRPDVVINLVDATNLERNLYLTTQILTLGLPVVMALNMMDVVEKNGDKIDVEGLSEKLGCPIVGISALRNRGTEELMAAVEKAAQSHQPAAPRLSFTKSLADAVMQVEGILGSAVDDGLKTWYAIKMLEGEGRTEARLKLPEEKTAQIAKVREMLEAEYDDDIESIVTSERYDMISDITAKTVRSSGKSLSTTQKIDRVVTNRILGLPIFIAIMFFVYWLSISIGTGVVTDWANDGISGDGWLYTGGAAYEEAVGEWEGQQAEAEAYLAAAEEAGLDVEGYTAAMEVAEPEDASDAEAVAAYDEAQATIAAFMEEAETANVVGELEDEETGEVSSVDYAAFAAAAAAEEPDPSTFGLFIPGLTPVIANALSAANAADWVQSLVLDGIVAGVGAVIGFIPQLIILFLLLAILEGCGYMARVAFVMDRIFRRFGLSGKSFIPMLIASGCGVPAVMATKAIENERDRRMTVMTTTMIPCGAKMPIIALVFGALAGGNYEETWWVAPMFYFLGLAAIIVSCIILKKTKMFAGETMPFVMELPHYHIPTVKSVLMSTWERVKGYIVKAGTIIFLSSVVIWFLSSFGFYEGSFGLLDTEVDDYMQYSLMAYVGNAICWLFAPLGFGTWDAAVTSITGLVAKENVVATVGILTSMADAGEADPNLWASFMAMLGGSSAAVMAFCAFNLLCAPCFAAIGTIRREMASAKWTWFAIGYLTVFAWCIGVIIYQLGGLVTGEVAFGPFTILALALLAGLLFLLFRPMPKRDEVVVGKVLEGEAA
ncbi:MAG TPA: ferrous iron transporter B [Candidatus Aveggerthella stercoripullorum]|uniref:Fe(2+) transporter FeoB n=1 Tax=Candidatus Aveggerthella stercoripullorum TaxID=2840688 RepID=A0A9D1D4A7_9ACTN|nr:ferrous iron transporter B [Candidatus Aveggerthella stercoripullorum]